MHRTFEFGLVPRSLFASDGSLLLAYDNATVLHHLEKDATSQNMETEDGNRTTSSRVVIFDDITLVITVSKNDNMKTCRDFAESFLENLINLVAIYDEVKLVFYIYISEYLPQRTTEEK